MRSLEDTKYVLLMSNCHEPAEATTIRKQKDGTVKEVACPVPITFYNKYMGGVDHADQMIVPIAFYNKYMGGVDYADQMIGLYDIDRKSRKWWRKVFFRLLLTAVYNSYIIFCETNHK